MANNIDYNKVIKYLIEHEPHNIDAICEVLKNHDFNDISYESIFFNENWSIDEKERILRTYYDIQIHDNTFKVNEKSLFHKMVNYDFFDEYMLFLKVFKNNIYYGVTLNAIYGYNVSDRNTKFAINDLAKIVKFVKPLLEIIPKEEIKQYFLAVIRTEDLDLIKQYAPYVDHLEQYFGYIFMQDFNGSKVAITKTLIDCGANPNHLPEGRGNDQLTPLKAAIRTNNFDIVKLLVENGADINLTRSRKDIPYRFKSDLVHFASPLSYASTMDGVEKGYDDVKIRFDTHPDEWYCQSHDYILLDSNNETLKERIKIIDYLFENSNKNVNQTKFIKTNLVLRNYDNIHKYMTYFKEHNKPVDISAYTDLIWLNGIDYKNPELVDLIVDIIDKYSSNPQLKITKILNESIKNASGFLELSYFEKTLLEYLDENHRKRVRIVPYVKTIEDLEYLLGLGFNINQTTENGLNILMQQLGYYYEYEQNDNIDLFNYLAKIDPETNTSLIDLTHKDKEGKNALYYAIEFLKIDDSFVEIGTFTEIGTRYEKKKITRCYPADISNRERFIIDLINLLPEQEINDPHVIYALEEQFYNKDSNCIKVKDYIKTRYLLCHKELLLALRKHFKFSDELLKHILKDLYGEASSIDEISADGDEHFVRCYGKFPIFSETLDFIYENLDKNCEIQDISIEANYGLYTSYLENNNITFEQFLCMLRQIGMDIDKLNEFKKEVVPKKIDPKRYLDYAFWKYRVIYEDLDDYALLFLLEGIHRFGAENLDDMLAVIPNVNINKSLYLPLIAASDGKKYLDSYYNACIEPTPGLFMDHNTNTKYEYIYFTGTLIHFAILNNDLELVKKLKDNYARIFGFKNIDPNKFIDENNEEMKEYIRSQIYTKTFDDIAISEEAKIALKEFNNSEIAYLKQLKEFK